MSKKSPKSIKPAAPQVKSVKGDIPSTKPVEAKPAKVVAAPAPVETPAPAKRKRVAKPASADLAPLVKPVETVAPVPVAVTAVAADTVVPTGLSITALLDVGYGNVLFVRGEGAGLSWDQGTALDCVSADKWVLELPSAKEAVSFKFLLNDVTWSLGDNIVVQPGDSVVLTPGF